MTWSTHFEQLMLVESASTDRAMAPGVERQVVAKIEEISGCNAENEMMESSSAE